MMMSGFDFEGKGPFRRPDADSFKIDEGQTEQSAELAANELIAQHPEFTNEQLSVWTLSGDTVQIRERILSWTAGEDPEYIETPLIQRVAYAKAYLERLKNGIA